MTKVSLLRDVVQGIGLVVMLASWSLLGYGLGL